MEDWMLRLLRVAFLPMKPQMLGPKGAFRRVIELPVNVVLLRGARKTILIDTGPGLLASSWPGMKNPILLASLGLVPDLIVMTHLDFDHAGGLVAGTWPDRLRPSFPNTRVAMLSEALHQARRVGLDEQPAPGTRCVRILDSYGLIDGIDDDAEVLSGIHLRPAPGHRIGHACVEIRMTSGTVLHLADIIHHPLHAEYPEWDKETDFEPARALETRRAFLAEAADRRTFVVASHVAGPKAARIQRTERSFQWVSSAGD